MTTKPLLILLLTILPTTTALADPTYTITPLLTAPGSDSNGAFAVSSTAAAGSSNFFAPSTGLEEARPTLFQNNQTTLLPLPPNYTSGGVNSINNSSDAVGAIASDTLPSPLPALWHNGQLQLLPTSTLSSGQANGINNSGLIVGEIFNLDPISQIETDSQAALWNNGQLTILPNFFSTVAVNNAGQVLVANQSGFSLWSAGSITPITSTLSQFGGRALNDLGHVAGEVITEALHTGQTGAVAALWINGSTTLLTTDLSVALSINNNDQIVGDATNPDDSGYAFLWQNNTSYDLNSLIPANSGWILTEARAIDNDGQIVGNGLLNGQKTAFLLTPAPEPTSLTLLACCAIPLLTRRRP